MVFVETKTGYTETAAEILRTWLEDNGKTIAQLNRDLGYKSNYCYLILAASNPRPITFDVVGRLEVCFGAKGPARKIAEALRKDGGCGGC